MINNSILSTQDIIDAGRTEINLIFAIGNNNNPEEEYTQTQLVYIVESEDNYILGFASLSGSILLKSGATIRTMPGFLIAEQLPSGNYQGLAFYQTYVGDDNRYGSWENTSAGLAVKEQVVNSWNETMDGNIAETTEDVEIIYYNERGETRGEERVREAAERLVGLDGVTYDDEMAVDRANVTWNNSRLFEEQIIREETFTISGDDLAEGASINRITTMTITQITRGSRGNPVVTYLVEERGTKDASFVKSKYSETFDTQLEAEEAFDAYQTSQVLEFQVLADESAEWTIFNKPVLTKVNDYEITLVSTGKTFKESLDEYSGLHFKFEGYGPDDDAMTWSNGGNTLNIDDFDTPRITFTGVEPNPSGAVAFTIMPGFKASFTLETDSNLSFIKDAQTDIADISRNGNSFDFTMYGGDRLEIDIDNERENLRPFLVTTKGQEWYSREEADDEIVLTMNSMEQVFISVTHGTQYQKAGDGSVIDSLPNDVKTTEGFYSDLKNESFPGKNEVFLAMNNDPEIKEILTDSSKRVITSEPSYEDGFYGTDDAKSGIVDPIVEPVKEALGDVGEAIDDAATGIWDSVKWWLLGGVVVLGVVILAAVYINGKARTPSQVAPAPVTVVKA